MANDTLSTIQYSLLRQEQKLVDLTQKIWKEPLAAFLKDGNKITRLQQGGRGLTRYFNDTLYPGGGFGQVSSGGAYPTVQAESEIQPYLAMQLYGLAVGYTEHALTALEVGGRQAIMQDVQSKMKASVDQTQRRMNRLMLERGDQILGRADGAGNESTSFTCTADTPPACVVGDVVISKADTSGNARGGAGTTEVGTSTPPRVTGVDMVNRIVTLSAAATWTDHSVLMLYRNDGTYTSHNASGSGVYLHGVKCMLDSSTDTTQWDSDDDSTYDHCDYSLSLARSSNAVLNVNWVNGGSQSPDLPMFSNALQVCTSRGADPADIVVIINPATWQAYADTVVGMAPRRVKLELPGGTYSVPVIDGVGQDELKVLCDYGMPTSKIALLDTSRFYQLTAPGGWNKRTGNVWQRQTSSDAPISGYTALFDIWKQVALNGSDTSAVIYAVTTT